MKFEPLTALRAIRSPAGDGLGPTDVATFAVLVTHADDDGLAWPGLGLLALEAKVARSTVHQSIKALAAAGWLTFSLRPTRGGRGVNQYALTPKAEQERARPDRPITGPSDYRTVPLPDRPIADAGPSGIRTQDRPESGPDLPIDLPIELPTPHAAEGGGRNKRTKGPKPDIGTEHLAPAELAARAVMVADESLAPIVARPAALARDSIANGPGVDVLASIRAAGAWLRANPSKAKRNGAAFLLGWVRREQERAGRAPANAGSPSAPSAKGQEFLEIFKAVRAKSRRAYAAYEPRPDDAAEAARLAAHALERIRAAPDPEKSDDDRFVELVTHWTRCYLREDGINNYVANASHPLRFLSKNLSVDPPPRWRAKRPSPRPVAEPEPGPEPARNLMPEEARAALGRIGILNGEPVRRTREVGT